MAADHLVAMVVAVVVAVVAGSCARDLPELDPAFYRDVALVAPEDLSSQARGALLDSQETGGPPEGIRSFRISYASIDARGQPTVVTGLAYRPDRLPPRGGFPLIAFAHGTTGIADACAPSKTPSAVALIQDLVKAGNAVVATDYVGLGGPGVHPYLHGPSEASAVLDSIPAARQLRRLRAAESGAIVWGFSQGGHAALFASQAADDLARVDVIGVIDAAGPSRARWLTDPQRGRAAARYEFTLLMIASWSTELGLPAAAVATPAVQALIPPLIDDAAATCPDTRALADTVPRDARVQTPLEDEAQWSLALNLAAELPQVANAVPILIQAGTDDEIVPFAESVHAKDVLCAAGGQVELNALEGGTHISAIGPERPFAWIELLRSGAPLPSSC